ncbi:hypothetical protein C8Q76DRAFT_694561 [Earliella scabrosa]|nr:hypothetical protein C8Q76DRAFT_694561 [Earliella scabrosa]
MSSLAPPVYVETANYNEEDVPWPVVLELRDFRSCHNGHEEDVNDIGRIEPNSEILPEPSTAPIPSSTDCGVSNKLLVKRHVRTIRHTDQNFQLFRSGSAKPLQGSPAVETLGWIPKEFDVYYHHVEGGTPQLWIWNGCEWEAVAEGYQCRRGERTGKFLVLTEKQGPSWVSLATCRRGYTHVHAGSAGVVEAE